MPYHLQPSEFHGLLGLVPDTVLIVTVSGDIVFANNAARRRFGSDIVGKNIGDFVSPDHRDAFFVYLTGCTGAGSPMIGRCEFVTNETFDCRIYGARLPDGAQTDPRIGLRLVASEKNEFSLLSETLDNLDSEIRERELAVLARREAEARHRQILDNVFTYCGLLDRDGVILEVNAAAAAVVGLRPEDVVGARFADSPWWGATTENRAEVEEILGEARAGETVRRDLPYLRGPDDPGWTDFQAVPVFGADGEVVAIVPSGVDITERKETELRLARRDTEYHLALSAARSAAWDWRPDEDEIVWSEEAAPMLGVAPEDVPRSFSTLLQFIDPADRSRVRAEVEEFFDGTETSFDIDCRILIGKEKKPRWVRGTGEIRRDGLGRPLRFRGLIIDVDELHRAQDLAEEKDKLVSNLLESTAEGIYGVDLEGVCNFANPACAELLGYDSPDDLIGRNMHYLIHHHRPDGTPYPIEDCRAYKTFVAGGRVHIDDEVFWRKDGSKMPVEYWSNAVVEDGRIVGSVVAFLDITNRVNQEKHRELLMGELNHRVKNSLAMIQAMASHTLRNASGLDEFRDNFVGRLHAMSLAHDMSFDNRGEGVSLRNLIAQQIGPYASSESDRIVLEGPDVLLDSTPAHALGLAFHELVANAAKHGALSVPSGRVHVSWTADPGASKPVVEIEWSEHGGPDVSEPEKKGFGSQLIKQTLVHSLTGKLRVEYRPAGFYAHMKIPLKK